MAALAHLAARRILLTMKLRGGTMTAGEIAGRFRHAWPTTTRHLQVLLDAGLVTCEPQGRTRIYRLDRKRLALARDWIAWFFKSPG